MSDSDLYPWHFSECNHNECKPSRSSTITRRSVSTRTTTSTWGDKCVNKSLVKDNAKSFVDCEEISRDLMRCAVSPMASLTLPHSHCSIHLYLRICAAKFMPSHSRPHSCCSIYAALMQPLSRCHIYAAARMHQHACSSIVAGLQQHLMLQRSRHIWPYALMPQHLRCSMHPAPFTQHSHSSTYMLCSRSSIVLQRSRCSTLLQLSCSIYAASPRSFIFSPNAQGSIIGNRGQKWYIKQGLKLVWDLGVR